MCYLATVKAFLPTKAQEVYFYEPLQDFYLLFHWGPRQNIPSHTCSLQCLSFYLSGFYTCISPTFLLPCHFRKFILNLFLQGALNYATTKDTTCLQLWCPSYSFILPLISIMSELLYLLLFPSFQLLLSYSLPLFVRVMLWCYF